MLNSVNIQGTITKFKDNKANLVYRGEGDSQKVEGKLSCTRNFRAKGKEYPDADFIEFEGWGKIAKTFQERVNEGDSIIIEGELFVTDNYEKDGQTFYGRLKVKVRSIQFLTPKGANAGNNTAPAQNANNAFANGGTNANNAFAQGNNTPSPFAAGNNTPSPFGGTKSPFNFGK